MMNLQNRRVIGEILLKKSSDDYGRNHLNRFKKLELTADIAGYDSRLRISYFNIFTG